ncbi:MAG: hypothetical protein JWN45_1428 [Acidobacteriaceae bacterium]|nr:hypothetical protein [Acidobacteriaceae bacterium]
MSENLIDARKSRRKIIEFLTKQQLDDSCCAEKLTQVGLRGKRRILELLAAWLVSFEPGTRLSDSDRRVLMNTQLDIEGWLQLQQREAALDESKDRARYAEGELYKIYGRVAPNGTLSILLMSGAEKDKAERAQEEYRSAKANRESIERDLLVVRQDIQKTIGRFLREAASPESLQRLVKESSVKEDLFRLIQDAGQNGMSVWEPHAQGQMSLLREIEKELADSRKSIRLPMQNRGNQNRP